MVAGKVKAAMGFQRSPATPKTSARTENPRRSSSSPAMAAPAAPGSNGKGGAAAFARSFGVYFPRSSAQVQPRPATPDVAELLRLVEELQERESRLLTQLLEHKLLKETVAIVPFLEQEIAARDEDLERSRGRVLLLEAENLKLKDQIESLSSKARNDEDDGRRKEQKIKELELELEEVKRTASEQSNAGDTRRLSWTGPWETDECSSSQRFQGLIDASTKSNLLKNFKKPQKLTEIGESNSEMPKPEITDQKADDQEAESTQHSRAGDEKEEVSRPRAPRVPRPPPTRSASSTSLTSSTSSSTSDSTSGATSPKCPTAPPPPPPPPVRHPGGGPASRANGARPPPPPPPPPPKKGVKPAAAVVRRVPEVVEFYHSLMRRDSKREAAGQQDAAGVGAGAANARDMIGEIENRSAHLIAIKTDVEIQGDFIRFLIKEVESAAFTDIEDVVAFVKWLDDELSFLVDERAVLKHFKWPEHKADALREAAFGYCDLKKLKAESSFLDDPRQPCALALKKMQGLFDKLEQGVYNLSRVREGAMKRYKGFKIPWEWMLETGYVSQIKLASVKLALKYMKRVSSELEDIAGSAEEEDLMLQGVRFAFRVHQFAGGFDVETMRAFQELKDKARKLHLQSQSHQQKAYCRSTSY